MAFTKKDAPNCDWCPYKKNCFYDLLGDAAARKYWREMRIANIFKAGETVFYEGEKPQGVYVVCTGRVKIYKTSRLGQQLVTRIESPGDLLGHRSMLSSESYTGTSEAMTESVVSLVDEETFVNFLARYPKASLALLRELAKDVRRGEDKARDIAFKPARGRLASTLLKQMHEAGAREDAAGSVESKSLTRGRAAARGRKPGAPGVMVVSGLKRKDLAEMAGLTIETTVRLLKDFEIRGLVKKSDKDVRIIDQASLRSIADRYQ